VRWSTAGADEQSQLWPMPGLLATLILAGLFWLNLAEVWHIYALLLLRATGAAFHWPAMQAS
jgi:hypothetical protein